MITTARAYAKVNFGLNVLPKESSDDFHQIQSIFQTIDLFDELSVVKNQNSCAKSKKIIVECDSMLIPKNNTLSAAYDAFCDVAKVEVPAVKVFLKKRIPSGGGLGGGSSDAASLVFALENLCNIKLNAIQKNEIARKTGSDVFFFMNCDSDGSCCAVVTGRGEKVRKIDGRKLWLLMIFLETKSLTKEAYSLVDLAYKNGKLNKVTAFNFDCDDLQKIYDGALDEWSFFNSFEVPVSEVIPEINLALEDLRTSGAAFVQMSGSGSTVFGVYNSKESAEIALQNLSKKWNCKAVQTV